MIIKNSMIYAFVFLHILLFHIFLQCCFFNEIDEFVIFRLKFLSEDRTISSYFRPFKQSGCFKNNILQMK